MSSIKDRVRYSRINTVPKNTLLTFRDGDLIHFGIARCNIGLDQFNRSRGRLIAKNRARLAAGDAGVGGIPGKQLKVSDIENIIIHTSGLRGTVKVENIRMLLQYFDNIETVMLPERLQNEIFEAA